MFKIESIVTIIGATLIATFVSQSLAFNNDNHVYTIYNRLHPTVRRSLTRNQQQQTFDTLNVAASTNRDNNIVVGRFKAPAPEQIVRHRVPIGQQFGAQTLSASFRVAGSESDKEPKLVHGIQGASSSQTTLQARVSSEPAKRKVNGSNMRTVSAKMLVSDDGLNYPPSKLSADIYGNVAEIVTAPPEAVDLDILAPESRIPIGRR